MSDLGVLTIHLQPRKHLHMNTSFPKNALISVSDKLGLVDFARGLAAAGVEIYSTGGTQRHLESQGVAARDIAAYTGFPEMMGGRVKTLHPKIFGGILCRADQSDDVAALNAHDMCRFDLVVVNLYPFEATIAREGVTIDEAIEKIDIGGPSLVRAAAKNHSFVTIATHPEQYSQILDEIETHGQTSPALRRRLAAEAFARCSQYDRAITEYLSGLDTDSQFPPSLHLELRRNAILRYGENPHQHAAVYADPLSRGANLIAAHKLHGKDLSYNNLVDLDSALAIVRSMPQAATVVIKHNNPCGAACRKNLAVATEEALAGDPVSSFGSILGLNQTVDAATAEVLTRPGLFIEAIVAPEFHIKAIELLTTKPKWRDNVRLLQVGPLEELGNQSDYRSIAGGLLVQDADHLPVSENDWKLVTRSRPADEQIVDLHFAWSLVRHVKSNAIVLVRDRALVGVGAGQMSRVDSVQISIGKAEKRAHGAVLASDAFFPFADSIHHAAEAGVAAVIQPGGSRRDDEVIAACDEHQLPMIFTGQRHFKH